jgi:uncharacterized protein (DUF3820 family)
MSLLQEVRDYKDVITFGKYKGHTYRYIIDIDPSYIDWLDSQEIVKLPARMMKKVLHNKKENDIFYDVDISHADDDIINGGCDPNMWGD